MDLEYETETYLPKKTRSIVISWSWGGAELHILKYPPNATEKTTFEIIGRAHPNRKYSSSGPTNTCFNTIYDKYHLLQEKVKLAYPGE